MDTAEQIDRLSAAERCAVGDLKNQPLPHSAGPHRTRPVPLGADPSPHRFGRLVIADLAAGDLRQLLRCALPAPVPYRRFITWLEGQDNEAAEAAWRTVLDGFDTPTLVGPPGRMALGKRGVESFMVSAETTEALTELARSCHTTVSTVLQAGWAQVLMMLTGAATSPSAPRSQARPAEVAGADMMVGLLINTVPVRASITPSTTVADLLRPDPGQPQRHPSSTTTWHSTTSTTPPDTNNCSTPCSSTRTTQSTPQRCRVRTV